MICDHAGDKWRNYLAKCCFHHNLNNMWLDIRNLSNKQAEQQNVNITFSSKEALIVNGCAHEFNKQFTPNSSYRDRTKRRTLMHSEQRKTTSPPPTLPTASRAPRLLTRSAQMDSLPFFESIYWQHHYCLYITEDIWQIVSQGVGLRHLLQSTLPQRNQI